jgi:hypothetical protein
VGVKADVIYYVPELSRHETSALGFAQQLRSGMWSLLAIPDHRPWSSLLDPAKRGAVETFFGAQALAPVPGYSADHPLEVNIVVSVRTNHWRDRLIANYVCRQTRVRSTVGSCVRWRVRWCTRVSPETSYERGMRGRRDDTSTTWAPGLVAAKNTNPVAVGHSRSEIRAANLYSSWAAIERGDPARLGSAYHGVVANFTKEGTEPRPRS